MAPIFTIIPKKPELIVPSQSIPREIKALSDINDQESMKCNIPVIMFYKNNPHKQGVDPVNVIREALAKTLVYYYPYAGRLIEGPHHKLMVDCTAQGVVFLEADAGISIAELGDTVQPPCQYPQLLLVDVEGFDGKLGCPLMLVQVTHFKCGGFSLAICFNHVLSGGFGSLLFATTMSQMARGALTPCIFPIWKRELLTARSPPSVTHIHPEYKVDDGDNNLFPSIMNNKNIINKRFSFSPDEIKAIRTNLPPEARSCSKYELITACLWRSRTRALQFDPDNNVRMTCAVDIRGKQFLDMPI